MVEHPKIKFSYLPLLWKLGHFKSNCRKWFADRKDKASSNKKEKWKVNKAASQNDEENVEESSDSDALDVFHAILANSRGNWIVDSGATCHMCNNGWIFAIFKSFKKPQ